MANLLDSLKKTVTNTGGNYTLALVQQSLDVQKQKELSTVMKRFADPKSATVYKEADEMANKVLSLRGHLDRVENAVDVMLDLRVQIGNAYDLVSSSATNATGDWTEDAATFNSAIEGLNSFAGNYLYSEEGSLTADSGDAFGNWAEESTLLNLKPLSATVTNHYSGSRYVIAVDSINGQDASGVHLNLDENTTKLEGYGPATDLDKWSLNSLDDSDAVSVTNTETGDTFTGQIRRGGLGVLSAWAYDGLATEDGRNRALADLSAAMNKLDEIEQDFRFSSLQLTGMITRGESISQSKTKEYEELSAKELSDKTAAQLAVTTRYDLMKHSLALTNQASQNLMNQMFSNTYNASRKMSVTDRMMLANGL